MNVTFVTTAHTSEEARRMLALFGMPFKGGRKINGCGCDCGFNGVFLMTTRH